tara:strand:+ start:4091 stop:5242 length:1152 start_codon:yes stop_codon:yes gene_type:complete
MDYRSIRVVSLTSLAIIASVGFTACTVDQEAAFLTRSSATGSKKKTSTVKTGETKTFSERMEEARVEREKKAADAAKVKTGKTKSFSERTEEARVEREKKAADAAKVKAKDQAEKKKADEAKARKLAAEKKEEEYDKKALAAKKAKEDAAEDKKRELATAKKKADAAKEREAKLAGREKAEELRDARRKESEVAAAAERSSGGGGAGFFSRMTVSTPSQYKSKGHDVFVNRMALSGLTPSNAKIEVDLSEQTARIYKTGGVSGSQLVIETKVSTGKPGYSTPTGSYRINEKLVDKRSTLYGTWVSSGGSTVKSSGESASRPSGASHFVGAQMPYWMRVNGGIGMHIGYVPGHPASHGCIRVPSAVQPLIYSKVGLGTQVTIKH